MLDVTIPRDLSVHQSKRGVIERLGANPEASDRVRIARERNVFEGRAAGGFS